MGKAGRNVVFTHFHPFTVFPFVGCLQPVEKHDILPKFPTEDPVTRSRERDVTLSALPLMAKISVHFPSLRAVPFKFIAQGYPLGPNSLESLENY